MAYDAKSTADPATTFATHTHTPPQARQENAPMQRFVFFLLATVMPLLFAASASPQTRPPNVIVIMADDLGYGDVSCYGAEALQTPHIDRLAKEGLKFTSGYCSASTCTPTRFSFLTGTYAFRQKGTGIAAPNNPAIIQPNTVTLPALLKMAGYRTAVIGKWHLGLGGPTGPNWNGLLKPGPREIGFDYCFLLPTTNDRVPQVYVENHRVPNLDSQDPLWVGNKKPSPDHPTGRTHRNTLKMDWSRGHNGTIHNGISRIGFYTGGHAARFRDEDLADEWVRRSVKWIETHRETPFFLFFSSHDLHVPRMPHERFQGKTSQGFRGDSIVQLDWCVGQLMETLDRLKIAEQTLVIFCSDNGPVLDDGYRDDATEKLGNHRPAGPYGGGKYSVLEGDTRTPLITHWPGRIKPGVSDSLVCTIDLAASLAALANVDIPEHACLDSMNLLDAFLGDTSAPGRDHLIQQDNGRRGNYGFRVGNWKLQRHDSRRSRNTRLRLKNRQVPRYALFNLETDPAEKRNVAADHPQVAQRMQQQLAQLIQAGRTRLPD